MDGRRGNKHIVPRLTQVYLLVFLFVHYTDILEVLFKVLISDIGWNPGLFLLCI